MLKTYGQETLFGPILCTHILRAKPAQFPRIEGLPYGASSSAQDVVDAATGIWPVADQVWQLHLDELANKVRIGAAQTQISCRVTLCPSIA